MAMEPDAVELRVLGSLIEKQRATPDHYPLTLNALRLACNQSTNRDPVVDYDEETIRRALGALGRRRWIRSASGHSSRAPKYRHLLDEELALAGDQISVLAILMLRGAQTPGELKGRTERLHRFESLAAVHETLDALIERGLAARLPRAPGQKEERFEQRLGGGPAEADAPPGPPEEARGLAGEERLARLERELSELRTEVEALRRALGESAQPLSRSASPRSDCP